MDEDQQIAKEPWLAVCLSNILPGLGQVYARRWGLGLLFFVTILLLLAGAAWAIFSPAANILLIVPLFFAFLGVFVANLFHAHCAARRWNSPESEQARKQFRDPFLAVFLTLFVPGLGHLYLRRWALGVLFVVGQLVLWYENRLTHSPREVAILLFANWAYPLLACLLACLAGPVERRPDRKAIVLLFLAILVVELPISLMMSRPYLPEAFTTSTGSMAPTIQPGDRVLVSKWHYQPHRGDVIVFHSPTDGRPYAKRLAAFAGETVEIKDGGVYIGGRYVAEGPLARIKYVNLPQQEFAAQGSAFTVPDGQVFVLGDNSARSLDSRSFGPIPVGDIIGKVYKCYWPLSHAGPLE